MRAVRGTLHTHGWTWASWLVAIVAVLLGGWIATAWRFSFTSDYALVGLAAKHLVETGEAFIFVPKVGYQGLLFETYFVALWFRLFGVGPITLNVAPYLVYLGFCYVMYRSVRTWHGRAVAVVATLAMICSSPWLYARVLRTQPNYGETFLMGTALFWLYARLLSHKGSSRVTWAAMGAIAGFASYTYGQIAYFLVAIGMHWSLARLMDWPFSNQGVRKWLRFGFFGAAGFAGLAVLFLIADVRGWPLGERNMRWVDPVRAVLYPAGLALVFVHAAWLVRDFRTVRGWGWDCAVGAMAAIVGFSPALYYQYVLAGPTIGEHGMGGDWAAVQVRIRVLKQAFEAYFGTTPAMRVGFESGPGTMGPSLGALALCVGLGALLLSVGYAGWEVVKGKKAHQVDRCFRVGGAVTPYVLLAPSVILMFLSAQVVVDTWNGRYLIASVIGVSVCLALLPGTLVSLVKGRWAHWTGAALVAVVIVNGAVLTVTTVNRDSKRPLEVEPVIEYLRQEGITHGYGDYWYSYVTDFLTREEILIEPTTSNYLPYVADQVREASKTQKIAYLDSPPYEGVVNAPPEVGGHVSFYDVEYVLRSRRAFGEVEVYIAERVHR